MDWILEHLQFVIAAIIIVGYVLRGMRKAQGEEPPGTDPARQPGADPDEAERTRRIQEEIRRRILERRRGGAPAEPPPVIVFEREEQRPVYREERRAPPPIPSRMEPDPAMMAVLEKQRAIEEQLRNIRATKRASAGRPARHPVSATASFIDPGAGLELRRDLSGAHALRKAILLKEILGEPVGLRPGMPDLPRR
ncbi:MAG: hypothetical protein ACREIA_23735 [Opitutaceae bacterium]